MKRASVLLGLVALALAALAGCGGAGQNDAAKIAVVEGYLNGSNEQNWDAAAEYLADDVVFETPTGRTEGLETWLESVKSGEGPTILQEASNFTVDGNVVRWEMVVTFPDFEVPARGEAVVEDGKIQVITVSEP